MGVFLCNFLPFARLKLIGYMRLKVSTAAVSQSWKDVITVKGFQWKEKEKRMKGRNTTSEQQGSG